MEWLATDLEKHKNRKGIVVFTHHPMWYNWTGWMPVHTLLKRYPVIAVIAGHFHYNQDQGELDGIRYVVVGATGGDLKQASREAGNVWHVTVLKLKDRSADFELLPLDSGEDLRLASRQDMDRVQALDVMLYDLFNFGQSNPIYLAGGRLTESCDSNRPAKLRLLQIGNPIDVPVDVELELFSTSLKVNNAEFAVDTCDKKCSARCVLAPGKRIAISNNSAVFLTFQCQPPSIFWQAGVQPIDGNMPAAGDKIVVNIELSFIGTSGKMSVQGMAVAEVKSCP